MLHAYAERHPETKVVISEDDYTLLCDASAHATSKDIKRFLRVIFEFLKPTTQQQQEPIRELTYVILGDHMRTIPGGGRHICHYDPRVMENKYSIAAGLGPIAAASVADAPADSGIKLLQHHHVNQVH